MCLCMGLAGGGENEVFVCVLGGLKDVYVCWGD